jgi:hypothetical protein
MIDACQSLNFFCGPRRASIRICNDILSGLAWLTVRPLIKHKRGEPLTPDLLQVADDHRTLLLTGTTPSC